jgi:pimeloyl-ACP methyl ester carboxylesterase
MSGVPRQQGFVGANHNTLLADVFGDGEPAALFLHGGGQTRHAWANSTTRLAASGWSAYALDQRGHGDSEWPADGGYAFEDFAADVAAVSAELQRDHGSAPVLIGASLGGIASLLAQGQAQAHGRANVARALILVDITPRVDPEGVRKVQGFMRAHAAEGFATIEEAAAVVAEYLPHRPKPRSYEGLRKNLRLHADGRWRWHWDPRFLDGPRAVNSERTRIEEHLITAARGLAVPTLLVRGASSELVNEEHAREFLALVPHASYVNVADARHMVVGDRNDHFSAAVQAFLSQLEGRTAQPHAAAGLS